jgi:hypothetical protein
MSIWWAIRRSFSPTGIYPILRSCYVRENPSSHRSRRSLSASRGPGEFFSGRRSGACSCCWGVVQSVGHLTVNEDGEGSNPSAPAKFLPRIAAKLASADLIPILIPVISMFPFDAVSLYEGRNHGSPGRGRAVIVCTRPKNLISTSVS